MIRSLTEPRPFVPGTTGWRASDLADPRIERLWLAGAYEIVEGVLTTMPPAYFAGGYPAHVLSKLIDRYFEDRGIKAKLAPEVDIVIDEDRVARADVVLLLPEDARRQRRAAKAAGRTDPRRSPLLVPPSLVIESVSPGHERHDRRTKRHWYAGFGVPRYWIVDGFERTLECLRLRGGRYVREAAGSGEATIRPPSFPDLTIELGTLWDADEGP